MNQKYHIYYSLLISTFFMMCFVACNPSNKINQSNTPNEKIPRPIEKNSPESQKITPQKNNENKFKILKKSDLLGSRSGANDITLPLLNSGNIKISDFENSIILLNFWASWCGPCRWEMPFFEEIHKEFKNKNVTVIGISVSDPIPSAKNFAEKTNVSYILASDSEGKVTRAYNVLQLPTTFILNKDGEVIREIRNVANKGVLTVFLNGIIERNK